MSHYLERVAAMLTGELGGEKFKRPLILSGFLIALTSCGSATSRDIRAYSTCVARHPQEAALCEGPRQAYELDPAAFQARAAAIGREGRNFDELSPGPHPALSLVPLHPNPFNSGQK